MSLIRLIPGADPVELPQERIEELADPGRIVTRDIASDVYTLGAPGSADRLQAAHKAQRCAAHWPARCTCEGRRL